MVYSLALPEVLQTGSSYPAARHPVISISPRLVAAPHLESASLRSLSPCATSWSSSFGKQSCYFRKWARQEGSSFKLTPLLSCRGCGCKLTRGLRRSGLKIRVQEQNFGSILTFRGSCSGAETFICDKRPRIAESETKCHASLREGNGLMETQQSSDADSVTMSSSVEGKSLWSKLTQSVNPSGVISSSRVIIKDRHLAIPHVIVPDISWIDWKALRARGFEGVLFDKDNTLTAPYAQSIWPSLTDSLEECREAFGGHIALLSNSAGLYQYDPLGDEAKALENQLGIPVIRHGQKKPAGDAVDISKHFGSDASVLIMVGDRYFTDILYGNRNGLLTIRSSPLTSRGEPFIVKRVRQLEESLVDRWRQQGGQPPKHKFCDNPVDFIKDPACW